MTFIFIRKKESIKNITVISIFVCKINMNIKEISRVTQYVWYTFPLNKHHYAPNVGSKFNKDAVYKYDEKYTNFFRKYRNDIPSHKNTLQTKSDDS